MSPDEARFLDDCRFAKVVRTTNGDALEINGVVIEVFGPVRSSLSAPSDAVESYAVLIARALRMIDVRLIGLRKQSDPRVDYQGAIENAKRTAAFPAAAQSLNDITGEAYAATLGQLDRRRADFEARVQHVSSKGVYDPL